MPARCRPPHQAICGAGPLGRQAGPVPAATIAPRSSGCRARRPTTCSTRWSRTASSCTCPRSAGTRSGVAPYELGTGYTRQAPLQRLARVPLAALVDATGHSAHLAVLHGREVVYVLEERAPGRPPLVTDVGVRLPAQLTATGRAMLAALPDGTGARAVPGPGRVRRPGTASGPTSLSSLSRLLVDDAPARLRRRGRRGHARVRVGRRRRARPRPGTRSPASPSRSPARSGWPLRSSPRSGGPRGRSRPASVASRPATCPGRR